MMKERKSFQNFTIFIYKTKLQGKYQTGNDTLHGAKNTRNQKEVKKNLKRAKGF